MKKPLVYVGSTIPSFYAEIRTEPAMIAKRDWTREWWDERRGEYEVVTSAAVREEISRGDYPTKEEVAGLIEQLPLLPIDEAVIEIVEVYIQRGVMPKDPRGDALHLAVATYHKCDFLLTWNINHLANANKFRHIQTVNTLLGYGTPTLVTPLELLGKET